MIEIQGAHNTAVCYTNDLEDTAARQIKALCNERAFAGSKIRIMPDVHAGKGCTIGTTMTITDKVIPGIVGVDIGCGMETVRLSRSDIDFAQLDSLIRNQIPSGRNIRETPHELNSAIDLSQLRCASKVDVYRGRLSLGSLGGGNHFVELDRGENDELYLVVHSGSRHLGYEVANYYQAAGYEALTRKFENDLDFAGRLRELRQAGKVAEIQSFVRKAQEHNRHKAEIDRDLAYVEGQLFEDYIHDMHIIQHFAALNRQAITEVILRGLEVGCVEEFTTTHNYIDTELMIVRKGAVSAQAGERLLIPINMRDGSLICRGRGNADWNYSAPHGAGRVLSRKQALKALSLDQFQAQMEGIYTTCLHRDTLDESPMAYKSAQDIVEQIGPTADIVQVIKPVYNYKAVE